MPHANRAGRRAAIWMAALVLPAAAGCNMLPGAVTDLKVGDCFDNPTTPDAEIVDVQHRPCHEPHDAEVIAVLTHPAGPADPYPVVSGFNDYIAEHCVPAFESYTGRAYASGTEFEIGYFSPTLSGWRDGDRGFTCHVSRADDQKLTNTIRASANATP